MQCIFPRLPLTVIRLRRGGPLRLQTENSLDIQLQIKYNTCHTDIMESYPLNDTKPNMADTKTKPQPLPAESLPRFPLPLCSFVPSRLRAHQSIMQNKPNVHDAGTYAKSCSAKNYDNIPPHPRSKKQTQTNPIKLADAPTAGEIKHVRCIFLRVGEIPTAWDSLTSKIRRGGMTWAGE